MERQMIFIQPKTIKARVNYAECPLPERGTDQILVITHAKAMNCKKFWYLRYSKNQPRPVSTL